MVIGGDPCSRGREFESQQQICLQIFDLKYVLLLEKAGNKQTRYEVGVGPFLKNVTVIFVPFLHSLIVIFAHLQDL